MDNIILNEAIRYVQELGWYVFPTRDVESDPFVDKDTGELTSLRPKSPYTKDGFKDATQNIDIIKAWWKKYPRAGIGVSCGHSNLVCVDIDVKDNRKGFDSWMSLGISDAGTFHATTPSGGLHIVYTGKVKSHANIKAGVDIRSEGSYFVAPPSSLYNKSDGSLIGSYVAIDDWNFIPSEIPLNLEEKLNRLRGKGERKTNTKSKFTGENYTERYERVKEALKKIPKSMCDDYFGWIEIGMALKEGLGEQGFELWDEWSRQSSKYPSNPKVMQKKWSTFEPTAITIASVFYYAKQGGRNE